MNFVSLVVILFSGFGFRAYAHEIEEASAAILLRDQVVDVRINVDMLAWIGRVATAPVSPKPLPGEIIPRLIMVKESLKGATLLVDDKKIDLKEVQFPGAADVMAAVNGHESGHHSRFTIVLRGELNKNPPETISLQLPQQLGPVVMSFSQPTTQFLDAGAPGSFKVRQSHVNWTVLASVAAVFALMAICRRFT